MQGDGVGHGDRFLVPPSLMILFTILYIALTFNY